jgi:hypothetical protein
VFILLLPPAGRLLDGGTLQIVNLKGETQLSFLFEGNEAFAYLRPGDYRAEVIGESFLRGEKKFTVRRDERIDIKIALRPEVLSELGDRVLSSPGAEQR